MKLLPYFSFIALIAACATASAQTIECNEPNVLLVFDVSGSMGKAVPGTKYTQAVAAITAATQALDDEIRFGLLMFPKPTQEAGVHCTLETAPQIEPALGNGPAIFDLISADGANFWGGPTGDHDTPMYQALQAAGGLDVLQDPTRRSYVVLITDGKQDCCIQGDYDDEPDCLPNSVEFEPTEEQENIQDLVDQVAALKAAGLDTFVVGLQEKVSPQALNQMAQAGGTAAQGCNPNQTDPLAADNCYFTTDDAASLELALDAIAQLIAEEVCDGIDNDCNGEIDEHWPDLGVECDGPDEDLCGDGVKICTEDKLSTVCDEPLEGLFEECDGFDDDCDGETDEGNPCPENFLCVDGTCIEDGQDQAGDLDPEPEPDAGSKADVQDQPRNPEPAPDAGSTADVQDQPRVPDKGADVGSGRIPALPGPGPVASSAEGADGGCGCRTAGGPVSMPVAPALAVLGLLWALRRRQDAGA